MALFFAGQGARADVVLNSGVGGATYAGGFVAVPVTVQNDTQLAAYLTLNPVVATPVFSSIFPTTVVSATPPLGPFWMPNGPASNWIGPSANGGSDAAGVPPLSTFLFPGYSAPTDSPQGEYYYTTTFTGIPTGTSGLKWTSDNQGLAVFLNGHSETFLNPGDFKTFGSFSLNLADFVAGVNTLTFVVFNEAYGAPHVDPTGVRIEGLLTSVPEPGMATLAVVGALPMLGLYWARRRRAQA
jgi:hypothetical protein